MVCLGTTVVSLRYLFVRTISLRLGAVSSTRTTDFVLLNIHGQLLVIVEQRITRVPQIICRTNCGAENYQMWG
jgi:hypothetical protein